MDDRYARVRDEREPEIGGRTSLRSDVGNQMSGGAISGSTLEARAKGKTDGRGTIASLG